VSSLSVGACLEALAPNGVSDESHPAMTAQPSTAHYPTPGAKTADLCVHLTGLALALFGGGLMLGLTLGRDSTGRVAAVIIYAAAVLAMLGLSAAYNFSAARRRPLLRRFDQAGVFLMIAGSYTPFTTQILKGAWAIGMTAAVWSVAGAGIAAQLIWGRRESRAIVLVYLALGWLGVVALKPLMDQAPWSALALLVTGGAIYSTGVLFFLVERLKFRRAIWHGHVVAAAGAQWLAILIGVVLPRGV
jgi:hemolysin III